MWGRPTAREAIREAAGEVRETAAGARTELERIGVAITAALADLVKLVAIGVAALVAGVTLLALGGIA